MARGASPHRGSSRAELERAPANELMQCWPNGRVKLRLHQRLLHLRRENAQLFREGNYEPLNVLGRFAECAVAFIRRHDDRMVIVIVPRLSSRVGFPPIGERWQDTHVLLPSGLNNLHDVFSGHELRLQSSELKLSVVMAELPFAVLCSGAHS